MGRIFSVHISTEDLLSKKYKIVGSGTDGVVLKYDEDFLIKLYHNKLKLALNSDILTSETKRYERSDIDSKTNYDPIIYYQHSLFPEEDIRLYSIEALKCAIRRQDDILRTNLPVGAAYLDNQFAGSVIEASKGIQIHKLTGLPLTLKKRIMMDVLKSVRELLDNYVYHLDLANSPHARSVYTDSNNKLHLKGHSHVLVNPFTLVPNIIDLDGKSTVYMERYSEKYQRASINGMLMLLIEFLLQIDLSDYDSQEIDMDFLEEALIDSHVAKSTVEKIKNETISIEDMMKLTKSLH